MTQCRECDIPEHTNQKLNSFTSTSLLTASSTPGCPLTSLSSSTILIPTAPPRTSASTFFLTSFSVPPPILCLPALTLASTVVCTITSRRIRRCNNNAKEFARWRGWGRGEGSFGDSANDLEGYSGAWKGVYVPVGGVADCSKETRGDEGKRRLRVLYSFHQPLLVTFNIPSLLGHAPLVT
jgi:hypothetical protein